MERPSDELLARAEKYKNKRGIFYARKDGKLARWIWGFSVLSAIWLLVFNLLYILGETVTVTEGNAEFNNIRDVFIPVSVFTGLVLIGLIWGCIGRLRSIGCLLCGVGGSFSTLVFFRLLRNITFAGVDDRVYWFGIPNYFYWRHLAPGVCLLLFTLIWLFIVHRCFYLDRKYYRIAEEITFEDGGGSGFSEDLSGETDWVTDDR